MENFLWHIGANYQKDFKELTKKINKETHFDFSKDISFQFVFRTCTSFSES